MGLIHMRCLPLPFSTTTIVRELVGNRYLSNQFPNYNIDLNGITFKGTGRNR
jgi:hypothetical protein